MTATIQSQDGALTTPSAGKAKRSADPHYLALRNFAMSISALTIFGYTLLGFEQPWLWPLFAVITGLTTEIVFELISAWAYKRRPRFLGNGPRGIYEFLLPAYITSLAVNMLLYANNQFWPVMFGVILAVSAKHVLQAPIKGKMRHFMNPSNLGICACLLLFARWISISPPYMFSEWASSYFKLFIVIVILVSGTVLNTMLTKRVALIVGFMGAFFIQAFIRHWLFGVQLNTALTVMTGIAFVLFTNYMITDPGTTLVAAACSVHIRQQRRLRLRGADGVQHRLWAVLRDRDRLRLPRHGLVGRLLDQEAPIRGRRTHERDHGRPGRRD